MFKKTTFNWLENGSGWVDSRNRKKEWIYVTVVALFPLLSFSRWKKNLDCNFKRNDSTFCFQRRKKTRCWRIFHRDYYFRLHLLDTTIFFTLVTMWIFFLLWSCPLRCICTCPQHYFVISKREYCIKSTLKWTALSKQDWKAAPSYGNVSLFRRFWIATTLCQVALDGFADSQK